MDILQDKTGVLVERETVIVPYTTEEAKQLEEACHLVNQLRRKALEQAGIVHFGDYMRYNTDIKHGEDGSWATVIIDRVTLTT